MNHSFFTSPHMSTNLSYNDAIEHNAKSMQENNIPWEFFIAPSIWQKSWETVTWILADLPRKAWIANYMTTDNDKRQKKAAQELMAVQNTNIRSILDNIFKK